MSDVPAAELPVLRYGRLGGGYRREDVEAALATLLVNVRTVEKKLEELRQRSVELEEELQSKEHALAAYRAREERLEATVRRAETLLERMNGAAGE